MTFFFSSIKQKLNTNNLPYSPLSLFIPLLAAFLFGGSIPSIEYEFCHTISSILLLERNWWGRNSNLIFLAHERNDENSIGSTTSRTPNKRKKEKEYI